MSYQVARALKSITLVLLLLLNANQLVAQGSEPAIQLWSATERARIFSFGPWPVPNTGLDSPQRRRMNPLAGEPRAIAFGEHLFKDVRLSANGKVSCETCHQAKFGFTDGRARALGLAESHRNTMPLFDLAEQRWFGWDGGADSLWAATIRPLLDPKEMGGTPESIAKAIALHPPYRPYVQALQPLFPGGSTPRKSEDTTLVIAAMSLAAWMETIESERSAFDQYRDALLLNTPSPRPPGSTPSNAPAHTLKGSPSNFSAQAEKGLKLFNRFGRSLPIRVHPHCLTTEISNSLMETTCSPGTA